MLWIKAEDGLPLLLGFGGDLELALVLVGGEEEALLFSSAASNPFFNRSSFKDFPYFPRTYIRRLL